jgi:subtilisin family serine protease
MQKRNPMTGSRKRHGDMNYQPNGLIFAGFITFFLLLAVSVGFAGGLGTVDTSSERPEYAPGRVVFKLVIGDVEKDVYSLQSRQLIQQVSGRFGLEQIKPVFADSEHPILRKVQSARIPQGLSVLEACKQLESDPAIEWAEPVYYRYAQYTYPNDPLFSFSKQWYLYRIFAPFAWDVTTGSSDVVIAIIDTGIDYTHPDLADNIWNNADEINGDGIDNDNNGYVDDIRGWDFVSIDSGEVYSGEDPGPPDNNPADFHGHGTHVAGIAGAVGNNGIGIAGVCWDVSLMALRAGYKNKSGNGVFQTTDIAAALTYAADNGADIVNMSFGGPYISHTERLALDYCTAADVLLIAAAGNDYGDAPQYPAACDDVIAVAAVDLIDAHEEKTSFSNYGVWVDIAAHGQSIYSTTIGGGYGYKSGTSMACPIVAGAAGLVKSAFPAWSAEQIALQLRATAYNINNYNQGFVNLLGAGKVDAEMAVTVTSTPVKLGVVNLWPEETTGVSDGLLDPGETADLRVSVKNFGLGQSGVSVSLTTSDPCISILDGEVFAGDIDENHIATPRDDVFTVSIDPSVTKDHFAVLNLELSAEGTGIVATDEIPLQLNHLLGPVMTLEEQTSTGDFIYVKLLANPNTEKVTVLYKPNNYFLEKEIYVRQLDTITGDWSQQLGISGSVIVYLSSRYDGAVADDGRVHVVFMGIVGSWDGELFYTSQNPVSGVWDSPVQITDGAEIYDPSIPDDGTENAIAVAPNGDVHVVWADYRSGHIELYHRYHNGTSWSDESLIGTPADDIREFGDMFPVFDLVFDNAGAGYLFWVQHNHDLYMMKLASGVWSVPELVTSGVSYGFTVSVNSQNKIDMAYKSEAYVIIYRQYDGSAWSSPEQLLSDPYMGATPYIQAAEDDTIHIISEAWPNFDSGVSSLYLMMYDGVSWSEARPVITDNRDRNWYHWDFGLGPNKEYYIAGAVEVPPSTRNDLLFVTSNRNADWLPTRPTVTDEGITTPDNAGLSAMWSSAHPSGIAEYEYAIGTIPGGGDICYWSSAGTNQSMTNTFPDTPLKLGQSYYVSVKAENNNGFCSPAGSSNGITYQPVDLDGDGLVDFIDFASFAGHWMDESCDAGNDYCGWADFDKLGTVDVNDLRMFAEYWLEEI